MTAKTLFQSALFALAVFLFSCGLAQAQANSASQPDPNANPMLAMFIRSGAKVYYMGDNFGTAGWFITKDGQVQIAYSTPDNQAVVVGVLYNGHGENITSQQMRDLYDNNKEVSAFFANANNQSTLPLPATNQTSSNSASALFKPTESPGDRLMQALQNAAGVDVGAATAPKLYMVVDPNCPHCHQTWQELRTAVFGGRLQIRLVPIDALGSDSARAAAEFLHVADPLDVWDKYIGGDKSQLAGNPDEASLASIRANHQLIDAWHIRETPTMIYRAKNGQTKIVEGQPAKAAVILDDIGS